MSFLITKYSGEKEQFSEAKFKRSLQRSGAHKDLVDALLENIKLHPELKTTHDIYQWALERLKKENPSIAARYNLKQALFDLGPTGFPFEKYIAHLMQAQGYTTQTDQLLPGKCVVHEIDLLFFKGDSFNFAECKFHNSPLLTTAVQVPLYVKARYDDVLTNWSTQPNHPQKQHEAWVITNTRFTIQAIQFGECVGLKLLSWAYPEDGGLRELIDAHGVHPITALTSLTLDQKKQLISNNFLLCKDVHVHTERLKKIGINGIKLDQVIAEAEGVCKL